MKSRLHLVITLAALAAGAHLMMSSSPAAAADRTVTLTSSTPYASWEGRHASGTNLTHGDHPGDEFVRHFCREEIWHDETWTRCDVTLLHVDLTELEKGQSFQAHDLAIGVSESQSLGAPGVFERELSDFDISVYRATEFGARGEFVAKSAGRMRGDEIVHVPINSADTWLLIEVAYATVADSSYEAVAIAKPQQ